MTASQSFVMVVTDELLLRIKARILYNGVDIKEYDLDSLRARIGAVFQDYHVFATTVAENVMNRQYDPSKDRERVLGALASAGFDVEGRLGERGIDATLTREFDENGINLSGGEMQKVVIASVFAGDYDIFLTISKNAEKTKVFPNTLSFIGVFGVKTKVEKAGKRAKTIRF